MSSADASATFRDHDEYHLLVPPGVAPRYKVLRKWLERSPGADSPTGRAHALREQLVTFRAVHLVLRSAGSATLEVERDFNCRKALFRRELPDDEAAWRELGRYAGPADHTEVVSRAREMLSPLGRPTPSDSASRGGQDYRPGPTSDPYIVCIPSQVRASPVLFENNFFRDMVAHWEQPSLVTTSHAVEAIHLLHKRKRGREAPFQLSGGIYDYVGRHYQDGGFGPLIGAESNLYGTRAAIAIFKTGLGIDFDDTLDDRLQSWTFDRDQQEEVTSFAKRELDAILDRGRPGATIIDLFHALYIVKNLAGTTMTPYQRDRPAPNCPAAIAGRADRILEYIHDCFRPAGNDGPPLEGFLLAPTARQRCLTAAMFAHRIVFDCQLVDASLEKKIDRCEPFAAAAFAEEGGFGSSDAASPDMIHTYIGLTLNAQRNWTLHERPGFVAGIERFLASCAKGGGYALGAEFKPSAYGTRLALQVCDRLGLPVANPFEVSRFIDSLGQQGTGYRGHPENRVQ